MLCVKYRFTSEDQHRLIRRKLDGSTTEVDACFVRGLLADDGVPLASVALRYFDEEDEGYALLSDDVEWTVSSSGKTVIQLLLEQRQIPSLASLASPKQSPTLSAAIPQRKLSVSSAGSANDGANPENKSGRRNSLSSTGSVSDGFISENKSGRQNSLSSAGSASDGAPNPEHKNKSGRHNSLSSSGSVADGFNHENKSERRNSLSSSGSVGDGFTIDPKLKTTSSTPPEEVGGGGHMYSGSGHSDTGSSHARDGELFWESDDTKSNCDPETPREYQRNSLNSKGDVPFDNPEFDLPVVHTPGEEFPLVGSSSIVSNASDAPTTDVGSVWTWGQGLLGVNSELSTGETKLQNCKLPMRVLSLRNKKICQIACGHRHNLAVNLDGEVFAWGYNRNGELGLGHLNDMNSPQLVSGIEGEHIVKVAAGGRHSVAVTDDGHLLVWGSNDHGQLGTSDDDHEAMLLQPVSSDYYSSEIGSPVTPATPFGLIFPSNSSTTTSSDIAAATSGADDDLLIDAEARENSEADGGTVTAAAAAVASGGGFGGAAPGGGASGLAARRALGAGCSGVSPLLRVVSAPAAAPSSPMAIASGSPSFRAHRLNGPSIHVALPPESPRPEHSPPSQSSTPRGIPRKIASPSNLLNLVKPQSPTPSFHQSSITPRSLFTSPTIGVAVPCKLSTLPAKVIDIACGTDHCAAVLQVDEHGGTSVYTWGLGQHGQLGLGDRLSHGTPMLVETLGATKIKSISCGGFHTCVVSGGYLVVWGVGLSKMASQSQSETPSESSTSSQCEDQLTPRLVQELPNTVTRVACSHSQILVITDTKDVWSWSWKTNRENQKQWGYMRLVLHGKSIETVACGHNHCAAVSSGGKLYTWGRGKEAQLGHNSRDDCRAPRIVEHLAKSTFIRAVACGASHTIAIDDVFVNKLVQKMSHDLSDKEQEDVQRLLSSQSLNKFQSRLNSVGEALSSSREKNQDHSLFGRVFKVAAPHLVLSKTHLDFGGIDLAHCPINLIVHDKLDLMNDSKVNKVHFLFQPIPPNPAFTLSFSPSSGVVNKGDTVTVSVELLARCKTQIQQIVVLELKGGVHQFITCELQTDAVAEAFYDIRWDDLTLEKCVANGGSFAPVYVGKWRNTKVAIKRWQHEQVSQAYIDEFSKELSMMTQLRHPNLVLFIGACMQPKNMCIVSEWVARGSLYDLLHDKSVRLPLSLLCRMMREAALGVLYLHSLRIIHRDIKSGNYLVDEGFHVKLADFGVSRLMLEQNDGPAMTGMTGTVHYMAPEVMEHHRYTEKADVYGFGIVMWEMLTRSDPYPNQKLVSIMRDVCDQKRRPPLPSKCPSALAAIIRACWDHEPDRRPSFDKIVAALDEFVEELSTLALRETGHSLTR